MVVEEETMAGEETGGEEAEEGQGVEEGGGDNEIIRDDWTRHSYLLNERWRGTVIRDALLRLEPIGSAAYQACDILH